MFRWLRLMIVRRAFLVLLLICLGCSAQSPPSLPSTSAPPSDINRVVERQVRVHYSLPPDVKVILGPLRSSEFANYDALTVTFASPHKKHELEFLLSLDHQTLLRMQRQVMT